MVKQTFKFGTNEVKEDDTKKRTFSLTIPMDKYIYITSLISKKTAQGYYNYNLKDAFADGLELIKKAYPNISNEKSLERRFYRGGKQSQKIESYRTSTVLLVSDINWIDNFIAEKRKENQFFSKTDFIIELVEQIETFYKNGKNI
jgi:hypothetical protein